MSRRIPPPPPGFRLDDEDDEEETPPPPPGFTLDAPERRARPEVIDGDTVRLPDGPQRLWGMDAPELAQQGWDRNRQAVPVGRQARDQLAEFIGNHPLAVGPSAGTSYGRNVAPLQRDGLLWDLDVGREMVRTGNASAAPGFLASDPEYRFQVMQDERLARLNQLGPVNDNFVRPPAEHRANPGYVPARETVAQFFDTPTPIAGMSPEAERRYLELLDTAETPDEVTAFVEAHAGFKVDPAEVANWIRARDAARAAGQRFDTEGHAVTYGEGPRVLTDTGTGASGAAVRGYGQGFVMGGLDELGAVPDMLGLTAGRENVFNSNRRLADIWANNQRQNSSILGYDAFAHPTATTLGEVAGGLTSGFAIPYGAGARTIPQLAKVGGVYGAGAGFLGTDGGVAERSLAVAPNALLGAGINAVGGKALQVGAPLVGKAWRAVTGRGTPRGAGVAGDAAEGYGEEQALDAAQRAAQPQRPVDRFDIPPGTPMRVAGAAEPVGTGYPGPSGGRERQWIDIADIPPPPDGFTLDAMNDNVPLGRAIGMEGEPSPLVTGEMRQRDYINTSAPARPQRLDQPLSDAQMRVLSGNIRPGDMLPIPSNVVSSPEELAAAQAGRFAPAKVPHERGSLSRYTLRNWRNQPVPKVGPLDMVGWLRTQGGLRDQGGELRHLGIVNNAPRRGMELVGQEQRFGPIVNNRDGMTLDDAAHAAWERGYLPQFSERPTVNEFLEAVRETYNDGPNRAWLPDDLAELDGFYGRQSDRLNLMEQETNAGGRVFVDRSVPGDEFAPFPPPQAYEEWPAEAVQWAGNIRLDKLDTPQDISRAMVQMNNRFGLDASARQRVTQQETARLAAEKGMTVEQLLSMRGRAFTAEEALAARQLNAAAFNRVVNIARRVQRTENPGDEDLAEFYRAIAVAGSVDEQVMRATAEAGRALAQFKMIADSRGVRREVLDSLVTAGGGPRHARLAADAIIDAVDDPFRLRKVVHKAVSPRWSDKFAEYYIMWKLSGPRTHVVNAVSNTVNILSAIPEHALAAGIGGVHRVAARKSIDRIMAGEVGARLFSMVQGAQEGFGFLAKTLRTGETSDAFSKISSHDMRAISGKKGEIIRIPGRALNAADEFFKGVARRMELNGLAYRQAAKEGLRGDAFKSRVAELSANPPEGFEDRALDYARYMTFQRPLTGLGRHVQRVVRDYPQLRPIVLFVRTPVNLLKFATERSPAAPILKEWREDFMAGGARRHLALARVALGTSLGIMAHQWALEGRLTGGAPLDPAKNRFQRADGWQPYSVRIGDQWVSLQRLDPFAIQMGFAADLATRSEGMTDKQLEQKAMLLVGSFMSQLGDKTWLSGVADFTQAMSDPQRYGMDYVKRLGAGAILPVASQQVAQSMDGVQRERETFVDELKAGTPGLADNLLPQRDIWGRPVKVEAYGPDLISPFRQSTIQNDPANAAMLEIGAPFDAPGKTYKADGVEREWTPEQYDRLQELAGREAHASLSAMVRTPEWRGMTKQARLKAAETVFREARANAKGAILGTGGERPASRSSAGNRPPPPPGFTVEGEAAGVNIYRDLQEAIPGVRFESGFRDYAYNQSLKARGYNAADNSTHMDGDTFDMLPPPGKSLGWLRGQVGRLYPDAEMLVHDGHLHARFPGYYGAPVLGGAVAAGVRNPNAGMPAPPPGFTLD